jgi:hypothetical protein
MSKTGQLKMLAGKLPKAMLRTLNQSLNQPGLKTQQLSKCLVLLLQMVQYQVLPHQVNQPELVLLILFQLVQLQINRVTSQKLKQLHVTYLNRAYSGEGRLMIANPSEIQCK